MASKNNKAGDAKGTNSALSTPSLRKALELIGKVGAPTTILTALLFYFGWVRTNALYLYFGIDQSVLGFSTQDYLLRSVLAAYDPLRWILGLSLVAAWVHFAIGHFMKGRLCTKHSRLPGYLACTILILGVLLWLGNEAILYFDPDQQTEFLVYPSAWTIGVGLTAYGLYLCARWRKTSDERTKSTSWMSTIPLGLRQLSLGLVTALVILGIFWIAADYAEWVGRWHAGQIARQLSPTPGVIVYSQGPLNLEAPGVTMVELSDAESAYRYRYDGLRLLVRSNEKYFLLPATWSPSNPITIILPDSETIRVEVMPATTLMPEAEIDKEG